MKSSIGRLNKQEESSKKTVQNMTQRLEKRLELDRARSQDKNLSALDREMYANRTRLEENEMKYWTRGRDLQHGMYHANIKMTHGLMSRVKTVMDAYQDMLTKGHVSPDLAKALSRSENLATRAGVRAHPSLERLRGDGLGRRRGGTPER